MRCALVLFSNAAFEGFSGLQVSRAPGSTVVPSHGSPANLAGIKELHIWRVQLHPSRTPLASDVDFQVLARRYAVSGGDIRNVVLKAALAAAAESVPDSSKRIHQHDFEAIVEEVIAAKRVMRQSLFAEEEIPAEPEAKLLAERCRQARSRGSSSRFLHLYSQRTERYRAAPGRISATKVPAFEVPSSLQEHQSGTALVSLFADNPFPRHLHYGAQNRTRRRL